MIEARHLTKRNGKTVAVDDVSFVVRPANRLPRAQRDRQLHHHAYGPGPGRPQLGLNPRRRQKERSVT